MKHDKALDVAVGNSRKTKVWKNKPMQWSALLARMEKVTRTAETMAEYKAMSRDRQSEVKDVGGFVGGYCNNGNRSDIRHRSILCLDADFATTGLWDDWILLFGNAGAVYSTHKHTPEKPRLRLVVPLSRNVTPEEYQAVGVLVDRYNARELDAVVRECVETLGFPAFVKPCSSGSSIGISKAKNEKELRDGIAEALKHDGRVLIEEFINARELECAVIDLGDTLAAEVGEVIAADEFYDFDSKYNNAASVTSTHPDIPEALEKQIQESAKTIFHTLDCKSLSRVDFFLDLDTGDLIFNEINTLPGFTNISMYPMLAAKHGFGLPALIDKLIESV